MNDDRTKTPLQRSDGAACECDSHRTNNDADSSPQNARLKPPPRASGTSRGKGISAVSIEFVAKPQEVRRVAATIPAAIVRALKYVTGFRGCLVMISELEARLVTVVTLWDGDERLMWNDQNVRCVRSLLAPYVDRCLRVRTMVAHLPFVSMMKREERALRDCSPTPELRSGEGTTCDA